MCGLKCSVVGHTAPFKNGNLKLNVFADFDTPDSLDKYRILNISAEEDNRDGAAIFYAGESLLKRPEKTKVMLIISDGAPLARNYYGPAAEADMAQTVKDLRRRGVTVFAAAIGGDKDNIQRIFTDGFLEIDNLETMPTQMVSLIQHYVRK